MTKRYGQFCGLAHALELVGARWSMLIVRDLLTGPKRFTDLEDGLPGIPTNVLSGRLRELEEAGIVTRRLRPRPEGGVAYELTDYGRRLEGPLAALGLWGAQSLGPPEPGTFVSLEALGLALRGVFRPEAAGRSRIYAVEVDGRRLVVTAGAAGLAIGDSNADPDVVITADDPGTLLALLRGELSLDDAVAGGRVGLRGPKADARRFFTLFRLG